MKRKLFDAAASFVALVVLVVCVLVYDVILDSIRLLKRK